MTLFNKGVTALDYPLQHFHQAQQWVKPGRTLGSQLTLYALIGVYVSTIFAGAFAFGVGFDVGITKFWDTWNKGVSEAGYSTVTVGSS